MAQARAVPVTPPSGLGTWTVVDRRGLPIQEVEDYLHWLRAVGRSPSTVRTYARHLAHLYRWLDARALAWDDVDFESLCDFIFALKRGLPPLPKRGGGVRADSAVRGAASALREFYEFHRLNGHGPTDLRLSKSKAHSSRTTHHFLAHVEGRNPVEVNRLSEGLGRSAPRIQIIGFENDYAKLQQAARMHRDRLVLSAYYDLGLRIGQALGLRHSDLDPMRSRVQVERREDNVNGALSKRRDTFWVKAPKRFFDSYRRYLLEELQPLGIDSDYVFVNTSRAPLGQPCSYSNMYQQVVALGRRADIGDVNPHMLRHTHATALAKAGWTAAEIAARLGQKHASSADCYIHMVEDDLDERLAATEHLIWPQVPEPGEVA